MEIVKKIITQKFNFFVNSNDIQISDNNVEIYVNSLCNKGLPVCYICRKKVKLIFKTIDLIFPTKQLFDLGFNFSNHNNIICYECKKTKPKINRKRKRIGFYGSKCEQHNVILSKNHSKCYVCHYIRKYGKIAEHMNKCCLELECDSLSEEKVPMFNLLICNNDRCINKLQNIYKIGEVSTIAFNSFSINPMIFIKCYNFQVLKIIGELYSMNKNVCNKCNSNKDPQDLFYKDKKFYCNRCFTVINF